MRGCAHVPNASESTRAAVMKRTHTAAKAPRDPNGEDDHRAEPTMTQHSLLRLQRRRARAERDLGAVGPVIRRLIRLRIGESATQAQRLKQIWKIQLSASMCSKAGCEAEDMPGECAGGCAGSAGPAAPPPCRSCCEIQHSCKIRFRDQESGCGLVWMCVPGGIDEGLALVKRREHRSARLCTNQQSSHDTHERDVTKAATG